MALAQQRNSRNSLITWSLLAVALVSPTLMTAVASGRSLEELGDKKAYYAPDPHRHHGSSRPRTPACTPSTPSHGGGVRGTPRTPSHGGGGYYSPPSTPTPVDPGTPRTPSHGGGGYYSPPSTPTPVDPGTPRTPSPGGIVTPPTLPTPTTPLPPTTPYTPGTSPPTSPLFPIDPNVPPFFTGTCDWWRTHPQVIWGIFGYWGTLGGLMGGVGTPAANLSILDALGNTSTDGISALYREATASFLNSMVNRRFAFSTQQVRDAFNVALSSEQAAANQAQIFRRANEGRH